MENLDPKRDQLFPTRITEKENTQEPNSLKFAII